MQKTASNKSMQGKGQSNKSSDKKDKDKNPEKDDDSKASNSSEGEQSSNTDGSDAEKKKEDDGISLQISDVLNVTFINRGSDGFTVAYTTETGENKTIFGDVPKGHTFKVIIQSGEPC